MSYKKQRRSNSTMPNGTYSARYTISNDLRTKFNARRDALARRNWALGIIAMSIILGGLYGVVVWSYGDVIIRVLSK